MSTKKLSREQEEKILSLKAKWWKEAEPILNKPSKPNTLDGGRSPELAAVEDKYLALIDKVIKGD